MGPLPRAVLFLLAVPAPAGAQSAPDPSLAPYGGPSVPGVDAGTLKGKVMCGYQGWFNAEGDGAGRGWNHWTRNRAQPLAPGNAKIDLWPDVSELAPGERFPTLFKTPDGRTAEVFSSNRSATVIRHFRWMKEYGIDGAFVQRFICDLRDPRASRHNNAVLASCRAGANQFGRAYALMYDLTGLGANRIDEVLEDWRMLRSKMRLTEDPAYLHHRGKPLVAVWGVGFGDRRAYTLEECRRLVDGLKEDAAAGGSAVMLGVPTGWREGQRDAVADPALLDLLRRADVLSPWTVGRYASPAEASAHAENVWKPDLQWCSRAGLDYLPVVFPGFSWHNMHGGPLDQIPRRKGEFLWSQLLGVRRAGAGMVYIAMFDEVDEGTAIFKCTSATPDGEPDRFVGYEGLPSDFYLKLAGAGGRLIRGEIPPSPEPPR